MKYIRRCIVLLAILMVVLSLGRNVKADTRITVNNPYKFTPDLSKYDEYETFSRDDYFSFTLTQPMAINIDVDSEVFRLTGHGNTKMYLSQREGVFTEDNLIIESYGSNSDSFGSVLETGTYFLDLRLTKTEWNNKVLTENPVVNINITGSDVDGSSNFTKSTALEVKAGGKARGVLAANKRESWFKFTLDSKQKLGYQLRLNQPDDYYLEGSIHAYLYKGDKQLSDDYISLESKLLNFMSNKKLAKGTYYLCVRVDGIVGDKMNSGTLEVVRDSTVKVPAARVRWQKPYIVVKGVSGSKVTVKLGGQKKKVDGGEWHHLKFKKAKPGKKFKVITTKSGYEKSVLTYKVPKKK